MKEFSRKYHFSIHEGIGGISEQGTPYDYLKIKRIHHGEPLNKYEHITAICIDCVWFEQSSNQKEIENRYAELFNDRLLEREKPHL